MSMYEALRDIANADAERVRAVPKTLDEQLTDAYAEGRKDQAEEDRHEIERLKDELFGETASYALGVSDERERIAKKIGQLATTVRLGL